MNSILNLLNSMINWLFSFVGDWGIVIVLTTIIIRVCLLPLSIKQKKSISEQQIFSKKLEEIKEKYKSDEAKQQEEIGKLSAQSMKSMVGCLLTLLQIPIMYSLYRVFMEMPIEVGSIIVPWIDNLKIPDCYHIIPLAAVIIQLLPNIITTYRPMQTAKDNGLRWPQLLFMGGLSLLFFVKAPVTLGIYWITSGLFSTLETIVYNKIRKNDNILPSTN